MSKLRILCLHGFTSNGSVHARQVRHLTSALSNDFDFIFPDGPHEVSLSNTNPFGQAWSDYVSKNSSGIGHRAWWYSRDPNPSENTPGSYEGLEQSLKFIGELIRHTGPVDAIWGFSQGACFAGLLIALLGNQNNAHELRRYLPKEQPTPTAGVIFSGFRARFEQFDSIYAQGIDVPTLHVIGEMDDSVTVDRSEALAEICRGGKILMHPGGHDIPRSESDRETIVQFLGDHLQKDVRQLL